MSNSNMSDSNGVMAGRYFSVFVWWVFSIPACVFFFKLVKAFGEIDKEDDEE